SFLAADDLSSPIRLPAPNPVCPAGRDRPKKGMAGALSAPSLGFPSFPRRGAGSLSPHLCSRSGSGKDEGVGGGTSPAGGGRRAERVGRPLSGRGRFGNSLLGGSSLIRLAGPL